MIVMILCSTVCPDVKAKILAIHVENNRLETVTNQSCSLILNVTNFYAEAGGQVCDTGIATTESGAEFFVENVHCTSGYIVHTGKLEGTLSVGDVVSLHVDNERRFPIMLNHTSTHLLNFALLDCCTDSDQRGSLVDPEKLRFDFSNNVSIITEYHCSQGNLFVGFKHFCLFICVVASNGRSVARL